MFFKGRVKKPVSILDGNKIFAKIIPRIIAMLIIPISNSSGPPGNRERMADKDSSQSLKHAMTLLTHGGEIAADATKRRQSGLTAKGARNLLLHLDHAQVALGLIVGKGNGQIVQKGQDLH